MKRKELFLKLLWLLQPGKTIKLAITVFLMTLLCPFWTHGQNVNFNFSSDSVQAGNEVILTNGSKAIRNAKFSWRFYNYELSNYHPPVFTDVYDTTYRLSQQLVKKYYYPGQYKVTLICYYSISMAIIDSVQKSIKVYITKDGPCNGSEMNACELLCNGSFELFNSGQTWLTDPAHHGLYGISLGVCYGWSDSSPGTYGTPDWFYKNSIHPRNDIPSNNFGDQDTKIQTDDAYAGIVTYHDVGGTITGYREYIQQDLSPNVLLQGQKYIVGMYVSLSDKSRYAVKDIGMAFTPYSINQTPNQTNEFVNNNNQIVTVVPQVTARNIISDKYNWTLIRDTIVGNNEHVLTIGNFMDDATTQNNLFDYGASSNYQIWTIFQGGVIGYEYDSYYYIDSVFVELYHEGENNYDTICLCDSITLVSSMVSDGYYYAWNYSWQPGGTGFNEITVSPAQNTTYICTATDAYGSCSVSDTFNIVVISPVPEFIPDTVCYSDSICFNGTSTCINSVVAWEWDFGDGTYSNLQNPCHMYENPGIYSVTLTITNCRGKSSKVTHDVYIVQPEIPQISGFNNTCTSPATYTIANYSEQTGETWEIGLIVDGNFVFDESLASDEYSIDWQDYPDGGYIVVRHDSLGCVSIDTIQIFPCCHGMVIEGNEPLQLDNTTASSLESNIIDNPNYEVVINGDFIIDRDFIFNGLPVFKFGPEARIIVKSGYNLEIYSSFLKAGCEYMWDGIYIEDADASLIFDQNDMRDAINGIVTNEGGDVSLTGSKLHDNWVCMQIFNYGTTTQVNHPANVTGNTFSGSIAPNYLPYPPLQGHKSNSGIVVSNVGYNGTTYGLTIGSSSTLADRNLFIDLEFGVFSDKSNVTLLNNWFKTYPSHGYTSSMAVYSAGNEFAKYSKHTLTLGGYNTYDRNYITNILVGVWATKNSRLLSYYDIIDTVFAGIIYNSASNGLITNEIMNNKFNNVYIGYKAFDNQACTTNIHNNYIHCSANDGYGIWVEGHSNVPGSNYERYDIRYDTIYSRNGIRLLNTYCPIMKCNTITAYEGLYSNYSYGMKITNCNMHQTQYTTITGVNKNQRTFGVSIEDGNEFRYLCESDITNTDTAFNVRGNNVTYYNSIRRATWKDSRVGIRLAYNGYTGIIGDPTHPCKLTWESPGNSFSDGYTLYSDGSVNTIYYDNTYSNEIPYIDLNGSLGGLNFSISACSGWTSSCPAGCNPFEQMIAGDTTSEQQYLLRGTDPAMLPFVLSINDSIDYPLFPEATSYISKQSVYYTIKNDTSSYFGDTDLYNFTKQMDTSNMGKLYNIEGLINQGNYTTADSLNKLLTPVNDIETMYKYVYDYLAEYRMKDTLTSTAVNQLRSFAVLCPMEYGRAVYIAQSILAAFDSLGTVYESDCGNIQYRRTIQKDEADELTNKVNLYPNPASDNVIVEFDLETFAGFEIEFYDYLGNRVMTTIVNKNKGSYTINTFAMAKGLYLYNITSNGQIIQSGKLMIIK